MSVLLVACWFLSTTTARTRSVLGLYLAALCIMAAFYKPYETSDLYRTYIQMEFFGEMGFREFWLDYAMSSSAPVARLLFWCVAKTGVYSILPVLSALICYSLLFRIIIKAERRFAISKETTANMLFFVMSASIYISVIGGIRMMLAFSMITFCFYRSTVDKKFNLIDIAVYAVAILSHATAIVVFVLCMVVLIFGSGYSFRRKFVLLVFVGSLGTFFVVSFPSAIFEIFEKASGYITGDQYSDNWEYIMGALIIMLLLLVFLEYRKLNPEDKPAAIKPFNAMAIICMTISLVFSFEFSIFYRFGAHFALIFAIPAMLVTLEKTRGRSSHIFRRIEFRSVMLVFGVLIALLSCSRGSLSSLKFFEL